MSYRFERAMIERQNWFLEFHNEWAQFFHACNWYTFHPVFFEIEDERSMGGFEISIIIMGLGFRWRWNYAMTDKRQRVLDTAAEIKADPNWFENHCTPVSVKDINTPPSND